MKPEYRELLTKLISALMFLPALIGVAPALAQMTATTFSYQGQLSDAGAPTTGNYDLQFKLFDSEGTLQGSPNTVVKSDVVVTNGFFTVQLDFGATGFNGEARLIEIAVRLHTTDPNAPYSTLAPRQPITATPYAIRCESAETADNANRLAGLPASGYLQNSTTQQAGASFNISGDGTAGGTLSGITVNATTRYQLNGSTVLSQAGANNLFAGTNAGINNTTGNGNSFFGRNSGQSNMIGVANSFFGYESGFQNTTGNYNSFFGAESGAQNTGGVANSFFGFRSGRQNTTGNTNSFFGYESGAQNISGVSNSFFGFDSGKQNTTGNYNSFFGYESGALNTSGVSNSFFGFDSGKQNTTGRYNSFFGGQAGLTNVSGESNAFFGQGAGFSNSDGSYNSFFGAAAGLKNVSGEHNAFFGYYAGSENTGSENSFFGNNAGLLNTTGFGNAFFGRRAGFSNTTGELNSFFGYFAGFSNTTANRNSFFGDQAGFRNTTGLSNSFFGAIAGKANTSGNDNTFIGGGSGLNNTEGGHNVFVGVNAGLSNTTEHDNTFIGYYANGEAGITNATAIGARAQITQSNSLVLGSIAGVNSATASTNVGIGTTEPATRLHVKHDSVSGNQWGVRIENGAQSSFVAGMRLSDSGFFEVSNNILAGTPNFARLASSGNWTAVSDRRMKRDVTPLRGLLDRVLSLRPVSFYYKDQMAGTSKQIGFVAQEVEPLFPSLVTDGEVKTLNYSGLSVVAIGAVQELHQQMASLREANAVIEKKLKEQQLLITGLKKLVCESHPDAVVCN